MLYGAFLKKEYCLCVFVYLCLFLCVCACACVCLCVSQLHCIRYPIDGLASRARRFFMGGSGRGEVRKNMPGNYSQHSTRKHRNAGGTNQISEAE